MFKDVARQGQGAARRPTTPSASRSSQMDEWGVELGHGRRRRRGEGESRARRRSSATPTASSPSVNADPNEGMDGIREDREGLRDLRASGPSRMFPAGCFPQVAINDKKMYPIYAKCVELDIPVFVLRRHPRAARCKFARPARRAHRRGHVRLPRAHLRHPPRLRAVDRARGEAHAQVAGPALLDLRVRPEALPEGASSTTPTPAAPTRSSTPATSRWACRSSGS